MKFSQCPFKNVSPRNSKPLIHVPKEQITNLGDLNVGKKHWNIKAGHRDFRFLGSVIALNVVGVILLWYYHNLENIFQNKFFNSKYNTEVVVIFYCSVTTKLLHMPDC